MAQAARSRQAAAAAWPCNLACCDGTTTVTVSGDSSCGGGSRGSSFGAGLASVSLLGAKLVMVLVQVSVLAEVHLLVSVHHELITCTISGIERNRPLVVLTTFLVATVQWYQLREQTSCVDC